MRRYQLVRSYHYVVEVSAGVILISIGHLATAHVSLPAAIGQLKLEQFVEHQSNARIVNSYSLLTICDNITTRIDP